MFIHIDNEVFERRPALGVFLGLAGLVLAVLLSIYAGKQYLAFGPAPETAALADVAPPAEDFWETGRWVRLLGAAALHCDAILRTHHDPMAALLFGKVKATYVPAAAPSGSRFLLLEYQGDVDCRRAAAAPLQGVLVVANPRLLSTLKGAGLRVPEGAPVLLLDVGSGPDRYAWFLAFCALLLSISAWCVARYLKKWRTGGGMREY